jgi:Glyoxalase-like domain
VSHDGPVRGHDRRPDASGLARFYADLTGMQVTYDGPKGALISAEGRSLMFHQVSDYNPPRWPDPAHPQQAHLDLLVEDLDTGQARALELGAARLNAGGERFRVFADPAGHPFDLIRYSAPAIGSGSPTARPRS